MVRDDATGSLPASEAPAILVEGLHKTYGTGADAVIAVEDVSFEIERGSVVGLLGPNGAGKTTAIKSILGVVVPDAGRVEVAGVDVRANPNRAYDRVGAMLEGARNVYWRLTVAENLAFFAGLGGEKPSDVRDRHERLLEQFELADVAETMVNKLSKGMQQKVSLVTTLARDVEVIFLDEPTLGLDVETSLELRSELRRLTDREEVTVVLCSHDLQVVEAVCDDVVILDDGSVVVHEDVDRLLDLFETREYRVTIDGAVDGAIRRSVEREADARYADEGGATTFTFTDRNGDDLYRVLETLRENGYPVREVNSSDPDLEDVFLRVTDAGDDSGDSSVAVSGDALGGAAGGDDR